MVVASGQALRAALARGSDERQDRRNRKLRHCNPSARKALLRLAAEFNLSPSAKH